MSIKLGFFFVFFGGGGGGGRGVWDSVCFPLLSILFLKKKISVIYIHSYI